MLFWRTIKFLGSVGILFSQNTCGGFASCWIIVRNIYSRPTNSALIKASHAINKSLRFLAFFCAPVFRVNSPSCLHLIFFPSKMHFIKWHIYLPKETELWKKILWECPKPKTLFCAASSKNPSDWAQDTLYVAARSSTDFIRISARDNLHHWWKDMKSGESCVKMCKYIGIAVDV